jgi:hypothetical protein
VIAWGILLSVLATISAGFSIVWSLSDRSYASGTSQNIPRVSDISARFSLPWVIIVIILLLWFAFATLLLPNFSTTEGVIDKTKVNPEIQIEDPVIRKKPVILLTRSVVVVTATTTISAPVIHSSKPISEPMQDILATQTIVLVPTVTQSLKKPISETSKVTVTTVVSNTNSLTSSLHTVTNSIDQP